MNTAEKIKQLQEILDQAQRVVFFTGAGVSTDSGIPDFRSQDGLYAQTYDFPPEEIISHHFFYRIRKSFIVFIRIKCCI